MSIIPLVLSICICFLTIGNATQHKSSLKTIKTGPPTLEAESHLPVQYAQVICPRNQFMPFLNPFGQQNWLSERQFEERGSSVTAFCQRSRCGCARKGPRDSWEVLCLHQVDFPMLAWCEMTCECEISYN
jgi:hypothetical protein